ncbi:MAG: MFS transporter [Candidatus Eisenbacteria bacterium]
MSAQQPIQHTDEFLKRRTQNWLVLGLTYAAMYTARYNFSFANKSLCDEFGWTKAQIGVVISSATLLYGLAAIFNGPIADKLGGRKAMIIGAVGACVFNFAFGLGAYLGLVKTPAVLLTYFTTVWTLNMFFQSYSALALIKVNSGWFHVKERGVFSAIFGSMIQSGRAAVYAIGTAAVVVAAPWQWKFFIPSALVAIMAVLTALVVRDTPEEAGLPHFDPQDATSGDTEKITLGYVAKKVFTNPVALTIAGAEFCTGLVRKGFEEWFPRYMQEAQHMKLDDPIFKSGALAIVGCGILGAFVAGYMSDKVFGARRPPVAFIGYAIIVACLAIIMGGPSLTMLIVAFSLNSLAISMVHSMLSGTASMDFGGKRAAATAAGMFDGMQYVGGFFAGIGIGKLVDVYGWDAWAPSMIGFAVIAMVLMGFLWNARPKPGATAGH